MSHYAVKSPVGAPLAALRPGMEVHVNTFAGNVLAYVSPSVSETTALAEDEGAYYPLFLEDGVWCCASICTKEFVQALFAMPK